MTLITFHKHVHFAYMLPEKKNIQKEKTFNKITSHLTEKAHVL